MKTSVWRISLWKRPTIPSNQTNATSVTMHPFTQAIYGNSGEKPNKCNQCDYVSSYASALRTHLKTHGGEKSNTCNQWDFTSLYASALRTHLKTHSEEKSNKSNQCDYATSRAGNLRTHLKIQWGKVNVIMHPPVQAILGDIWKHTVEKSLANATNVKKSCKCNQCEKVRQMQPMWLCICSCKGFEDPF